MAHRLAHQRGLPPVPYGEQLIGCGKNTGQLPKWLVENRGLDALEKDRQTGQYQGCGLKNLERKTEKLASSYLAMLEHPESFVGVRLINSLACRRWYMLWGKIEKWS